MEDKLRLLRNVILFSKLSEEELKIIAGYCEYKQYKDEEVIFEEGTFGESLYIVKSGEVRIVKRLEDNKVRDIARFIPGELFGELDLFEDGQRTATAIAETDATLLAFPSGEQDFEEVLDDHPNIFAKLLNILLVTIAGRIRSTNNLLSEKTQWVADLRKQMIFDKLTGLYNITFIKEDFPLQLPGFGSNTTVLALKPDNFKYINDTYGHAVGDKVLQLMAETVKNGIRSSDIAIRYRGDEFVVLLPDTETDRGIKLAEVLNNSLNNIDIAQFIDGSDFNTTWSIGVATYPVHGDDHEEIIKVTFNTMLEKRETGGNGVLCAGK
ncbi:MAG: GGDEF domain-containing protein [Spirochaetales bacterium]|nr:GGDEF domain-containing protein [Spirochaetales bacterium]